MKLRNALKLILYVLPFVAAVIGAKLVVHRLDFEIVPLNAIFSALIGANVFLLGFLISGVLSDFKESEKLPGEIASALLAIVDEDLVVDPGLAELVLDHRDLLAVLLGEDPVQQRGLAGAEEAGEDGDGSEVLLCGCPRSHGCDHGRRPKPTRRSRAPYLAERGAVKKRTVQG